MPNVMLFDATRPDIGLSVRTQVAGPELDLMNEFVEQYTDQLSAMKRHYALFYEPLMPTGYPDLVVVSYNPHKYDSWTNDRSKLGVLDLKVLHHLHFARGASSEMMEHQLGLDCRLLLRVLERLMDASLVRRAKQRWIPKSLRESYGISNIRTIEGKISDWRSVFAQANMNQMFSSESCILSPVSRPSEQVVATAKREGLGIYSMPPGLRFRTVQNPHRFNGLPVSYASWLFNEWIGRSLQTAGRSVS